MAVHLRGTLPDYVVKALKRDQNGIFGGTCIRYALVGEVNQRIDLNLFDPSQAPNPWGLPCTDISGEVEDAHITVTYLYQGLDENFTFSDDQVTFEFDTSMNEDPIETHPNFKVLKTIYGWSQVERMFAETIRDVSVGPLTVDESENKENPLFGIDSWLSIGAIYRRTYASRNIPGNIFTGIGTIISKPPDIGQFKLPSDSKTRNWLKLAPKVTRTGNAVRISDEYMLSGPKGWAKPVYDRDQLKGS